MGGPKRCTVLAALLLNANRVVSEGRLINLVWGDEPPHSVRGGLQVHISELRALLGKDVLVRQSAGYLIAVEPGELDLHVFDEAVTQARNDFFADAPAAAAENLRFALNLWGGPALGGVAEALATAESPGLEERRLAAMEQLFDVELTTGQRTLQVGELRRTADEHPFRERLQAQLMLALHRDGRTPEALGVYTEIHRKLVDELGIEPGPRLQELHLRILNGAAETPRRTPAENRAPDASQRYEKVRPAELPHDARGFTGRKDALAALDAEDNGIWVISGPPGAGKTALAVHWAHAVREHFPDGQFYLNLCGFEPDHEPLTPEAALTQLLRTLGVGESSMPRNPDEQTRLYQSLLAGKQALILLDNARDIDQVRPLLPSSATALITSRNRLGDLVARTGARSLSLNRLSEEDAQALLKHILGAERVEAEPDAVADLARLCDYLPLALRIAAANVGAAAHRDLAAGVAELAKGNRLEELSIDGAEENAVTAAFAVSYAALTPECKRLFRLLGLVPGADFTPPTAAAVTASTVREATRGLKALTAANLIEQHAADRWRFHDLVRLFAAEQARADEDEIGRDRAWTGLIELYLGAADTAAGQTSFQVAPLPREEHGGARVRFSTCAEARDWLEAEIPNVLALLPRAAERGPHPVAWYLVDSVGTFLHNQERRIEWLSIAPGLLDIATRHGQRRVQAAIHRDLSTAYLLTGHLDLCTHHLAEASQAGRDAGWRELEAALTVDLGAKLCWTGHLATAVDHSLHAVSVFRETGSRAGETLALKTVGWQYRHLGCLDRAEESLVTALARSREFGSRFWEATILSEFGPILRCLGRYPAAMDCLTPAIEVFRQFGAPRMEALTLSSRSALHCDQENYQQARTDAVRALDLCRHDNLKLVEADALAALGRAETFLDRFEQAESRYRTALTIVRQVGYWQAEGLTGLARAQTRLGQPEAVASARQASFLAAEYGHRLIEADALSALAEAHLRHGEHDEAQATAREAVTICWESGYQPGQARARLVLDQLARPDRHTILSDRGA